MAGVAKRSIQAQRRARRKNRDRIIDLSNVAADRETKFRPAPVADTIKSAAELTRRRFVVIHVGDG